MKTLTIWLFLVVVIFLGCGEENSSSTITREVLDENVTESNHTNPIDSPRNLDINITDSENNDSNISDYPHLPEDISNKIAINFLSLSTFGATKESRKALVSKGIESWINEQLALPYQPNQHLKRTIALTKKTAPSENTFSIDEYLADNDTVFNVPKASFNVNRYQLSAWFETALFDKDQIRHRVAYALSQIVVESLAEPFFIRRAEGLATYMDILTKNALGNYKDLLIDISHSSSMGLYLTYNGSKKEQQEGTTTIYPDENYAREIMQLFTIGLNELNLDGTAKLGANGKSIPSYTQEDVNGLAKVFTGWDLKRNPRYGVLRFSKGDVTHPLEFTAEHHEFGAKSILGKTIQSGNDGSQDIKAAIEILMAHPNIAPFISKKLIMRLTKSNPTPAYVARVATVFNDNGQGVKGDLKAVVKAIYLDKELWVNSEIKKFKEPLLAYTEFLRAFNVQNLPVWTTSKTGGTIVKNTLYMLDPTSFLGQGPSRAFSVFNFYNDAYVPNEATFKQTKLVAPELQIQTDAMLIAYANKIGDILWRREKRSLGNKYGDINALISNNYNIAYYAGQEKFLLDCSEEYAVVENALEGSVDGNFQSFNGVNRESDTSADSDGVTNRDRALKALIEHLDVKLTGAKLTEVQKNTIFEGYKEVMYYGFIRNADDPELKIYEQIIMKVIHLIVTSETYMVQ